MHEMINSSSETTGPPPTPASESATDVSSEALKAARSILVVDDNRDSLRTMEILLRLWGHKVAIAYDGPSALAIAATMLPSIVLLDIGLPGMDGYEVARKLREEPSLEGVLLIATTGRSREVDRDRAWEAGFDHHLVKPIEPTVLARLVGRNLASP